MRTFIEYQYGENETPAEEIAALIEFESAVKSRM
jgi:hypothetical protein